MSLPALLQRRHNPSANQDAQQQHRIVAPVAASNTSSTKLAKPNFTSTLHTNPNTPA
jgi:hypothetical protein